LSQQVIEHLEIATNKDFDEKKRLRERRSCEQLWRTFRKSQVHH